VQKYVRSANRNHKKVKVLNLQEKLSVAKQENLQVKSNLRKFVKLCQEN